MASDPNDPSRSDETADSAPSEDVPYDDGSSDVDQTPVDALHRVELGLEWFHRAHGHLVAFHHNTGHAMDHFAAAEAALREAGHEDLADEIRDDFLPCGVLGDRWSYDVLETFQEGLLADADDFEERARAELADGDRHVAERRLEREWKGRAKKRE